MTEHAPTNLATPDDLDELRGKVIKLTDLVTALASSLERTDADVKYIAERLKPNRYDFALEYTDLERRLEARIVRAELALGALLRKKDEGTYDGAADTATLSGDILELRVALRRRDWRVGTIEERLASVETRLGIERASEEA